MYIHTYMQLDLFLQLVHHYEVLIVVTCFNKIVLIQFHGL